MPLLTNLIQSLKGHVQKVPEAIEEEVNKLEGRFGTVTLTEAPAHKPTTQSTPQFPGGFHPAYSASPPNQSHINTHAYNGPRPTPPPPAQAPSFPVPVQYPTKPGPLPRPPSMSSSHKRRDSGTQDVSNTLRYAMEGIMDTSYPSFVGHATVATPPDRLQAPHHPSRPYSDPAVPRYQEAQASSTSPPPSTPHRTHLQAPPPATAPSKSGGSTKTNDSSNSPSRGRRRNSSTSSLPSTLTAKSGAARCSGITKSGSQCRNMVKDSAALGTLDPVVLQTMKRYCHIHTDQIKKSAGYLSNNVVAPFETFIPETLDSQTQVQLKTAMVEKLSDADKAGYIYIYEVNDPSTLHPEILEYKVGRSYKPIQRVGQWENSCRSQRHVVRYIFPGPPDQIMLTGMMRQGKPAKFCHRLERLIHLELADLSLNAPYLDPEEKDAVHKMATQPRKQCIDCKKLHQEIFSFRQAKSGPHQGKEYEMVKEVVDRWGLFVNEFLSRST